MGRFQNIFLLAVNAENRRGKKSKVRLFRIRTDWKEGSADADADTDTEKTSVQFSWQIRFYPTHGPILITLSFGAAAADADVDAAAAAEAVGRPCQEKMPRWFEPPLSPPPPPPPPPPSPSPSTRRFFLMPRRRGLWSRSGSDLMNLEQLVKIFSRLFCFDL